MAWRCSWVWVWCLGTPANVKWPGEGIYIGHQVHRAVAPMATKNQLSIGWTNTTWTRGIGSTGRSNPLGSRWASDALPTADSEPISLTDAMHRWPIGSTGAEEICLYFPTALTSLHRRFALMRHRFNRCWRPDSQSLNMLSGQCPGECTDAPPFLDRRSNRCHWDFLTWSSCTLFNALMPVCRFNRWLSVRPVQGHRLIRCYWFGFASICPTRCGSHLDTSKNILSAFSLRFECLDGELDTSLWWIGHIGFYPWDLKILQMWSHKFVSHIDYVIIQSPKS